MLLDSYDDRTCYSLAHRTLHTVLLGMLQEESTQSIHTQRHHRFFDELRLKDLPSAQNPQVLTVYEPDGKEAIKRQKNHQSWAVIPVVVVAAKDHGKVLIISLQNVIICVGLGCGSNEWKSLLSADVWPTISRISDAKDRVADHSCRAEVLLLLSQTDRAAVNRDAVVLSPRKRRVHATTAQRELVRISANLIPPTEESRHVEVLHDVHLWAATKARNLHCQRNVADRQN